MTQYRIRHTTACRYEEEILLAHHLLHLRPRDVAHQTIRAQRLAIEPTPSSLAEHLDYFGNPTAYLAIEEPHRSLRVEAELEIEVAPPAVIDLETTPRWETLRARLGAAGDPAAREANRFAHASPLAPLLPDLAAYAAVSFPAGRPVAAAAHDLMARIHRAFVYDPIATTITTPLVEVLATRRGVCQDFAHLAIGCLRAMGLAARYVSGYLRTVPPQGSPRLIGADASHAWLAVWCGDGTWLDLDPTNGRLGSADFVTLAWGRDYSDVTPTRGFLIGGGKQTLTVEVDVEPLALA